MRFSIVVATDIFGGIGIYNNYKFSIPWKCKKDMIYFRDLTTSKKDNKINVVIMGRNTFFSLPLRNGTRKLPNRLNIVISSKPELFNEDVIIFNSLTDSLTFCKKYTTKKIDNINKSIDKVFVIGGSQLYEEALNNELLDSIYWNLILETDKSCNIYFPITFRHAMKDFDFELHNDLSLLNDSSVQFSKFNIKNQNNDEQKYLNLLQKIINEGDERQTRNSITKSIFGEKLEFDLRNQFPLLTTKKMFLRGIFEELVWFLRGQTDSKILESKKVNIWKGNSSQEFINKMNLPYREGDIGNMYGFQWKHAGAEYNGCEENYHNKGFDQIEYCLDLLKNDKYSRRILMTTYLPHLAKKGVLYPCHGLTIQWYVKEVNDTNLLSCTMYQRSADMFLGVPFNIASYSLLVYMFCNVLNNSDEIDYKFVPDKLIISFGDLHIYKDHYDKVNLQLSRKPYRFPKINIKDRLKLEDFEWKDFEIINYNCDLSIKANMVA